MYTAIMNSYDLMYYIAIIKFTSPFLQHFNYANILTNSALLLINFNSTFSNSFYIVICLSDISSLVVLLDISWIASCNFFPYHQFVAIIIPWSTGCKSVVTLNGKFFIKILPSSYSAAVLSINNTTYSANPFSSEMENYS